MDLFPKQSLESAIIIHLQRKSWVIVDLIEELRKTRPKLSKQAVYQVIRSLKESEIVIVRSKNVSLSSIWIDRMHDFFTVAKYTYEGSAINNNQSTESFLNLEDGDRIVYEFKSPATTDIFWGHAFNILLGIMKKDDPVLIYGPHQWFILARNESESEIIRQAESQNHPWYVYVPNKTPLDIYAKKYFKKPSSYYMQDLRYFKENFYVNLFSDFIIEVVLDEKTQSAIEKFYNTYKFWDNTAETELKYIISHMKGRDKLTISRDSKKAAKYKKVFSKYFLL